MAPLELGPPEQGQERVLMRELDLVPSLRAPPEPQQRQDGASAEVRLALGLRGLPVVVD